MMELHRMVLTTQTLNLTETFSEYKHEMNVFDYWEIILKKSINSSEVVSLSHHIDLTTTQSSVNLTCNLSRSWSACTHCAYMIWAQWEKHSLKHNKTTPRPCRCPCLHYIQERVSTWRDREKKKNGGENGKASRAKNETPPPDKKRNRSFRSSEVEGWGGSGEHSSSGEDKGKEKIDGVNIFGPFLPLAPVSITAAARTRRRK